jgi:hypothetical protein
MKERKTITRTNYDLIIESLGTLDDEQCLYLVKEFAGAERVSRIRTYNDLSKNTIIV